MQRILNVIPMILLAVSLPAFSAETPAAGATHRIQVYQAGKGALRVREAAAARKAAPRAPEQAPAGGRSQPYQPAKPGEGEPKG
jgi:hypothetical protein